MSFWHGREPFTVASVRETLGDILKGRPMPSEAALGALAAALNDIHGAFWFRKTTLPESDAKGARAERVRNAIAVLARFFDERRRACKTANPKIIEGERRLRQGFRSFLRAMKAHRFQLDMDRDDATMMPRLKSWNHVAEAVASAFRIAMYRERDGAPAEFGSSERGPVARFVAAVVPTMTGEKPTLPTVSRLLKRRASKK